MGRTKGRTFFGAYDPSRLKIKKISFDQSQRPLARVRHNPTIFH